MTDIRFENSKNYKDCMAEDHYFQTIDGVRPRLGDRCRCGKIIITIGLSEKIKHNWNLPIVENIK